MKENGSLEFGQLPILHWPDGTHMAQSHAILRALGVQYGYYPPSTEPLERWLVDSTLDAIGDIYEVLAKSFFVGSVADKEAAIDQIMLSKLPMFLEAMDKRLSGDKRFINGHEITIADFALGSLLL